MNNKLITMIIPLLIIVMTTPLVIHNVSAYSRLSPEDQNYNHGFYEARSDCYQVHTCWAHFHSPGFYDRPLSYRDGYTAVVDYYYSENFAYCAHDRFDCSGTNDYDHDLYQPDDNGHLVKKTTNNVDDSTTTTNTATTTDTQQKTNQNIVNEPKISCVGKCVISTSPIASSTNANTGGTTTATNNNDNTGGYQQTSNEYYSQQPDQYKDNHSWPPVDY